MKMNIYTNVINQFALPEGWKLVEKDGGILIESVDQSLFLSDDDAIEHVVDSAIECPKSFHADALIFIQLESRPALNYIKQVVGVDKWIRLYAAVMAVPEFA